MTDNNTVFQAADQPEGTINATDGDLLSQLVGEGKKFKDPEALAKGKLESDAFIEQIKNENAGLRKELEERVKLSQILDEIKKGTGNQPGGSKDTSQPQALDPDEVKKLIKNTLNETVQENTAKQNVLEAERTVIEKLGSKDAALKFITEKAREMGVSGDWLMSVAASNPKALYAVLGLEATGNKQQPTNVTSPDSSVNTSKQQFAPNGGQVKAGTKDYFEKIRKENPSLYWKPEIQNEIFEARKRGTYVSK